VIFSRSLTGTDYTKAGHNNPQGVSAADLVSHRHRRLEQHEDWIDGVQVFRLRQIVAERRVLPDQILDKFAIALVGEKSDALDNASKAASPDGAGSQQQLRLPVSACLP